MRENKISVFRIPSTCILLHQGEEMIKLSEERRRQWLANINQADIDDANADHSRAAQTHCIEEPCNVELNEQLEEETTAWYTNFCYSI